MDEEISAANNALNAIQKSFTSFNNKYGTGKVSDEAAMKNFTDLKNTLIAQYPKNSEISTCPDIQRARDQYNLLADSIQHCQITIENSNSDPLAAIGGEAGRALDAKCILSNARMLDNTIARWLVSKDSIERDDLATQCRNIIKDTSVMIGNSHGQTPEEQNAISLFRKAEQYFNKICK